MARLFIACIVNKAKMSSQVDPSFAKSTRAWCYIHLEMRQRTQAKCLIVGEEWQQLTTIS
jgi:hypothetical protein